MNSGAQDVPVVKAQNLATSSKLSLWLGETDLGPGASQSLRHRLGVAKIPHEIVALPKPKEAGQLLALPTHSLGQ